MKKKKVRQGVVRFCQSFHDFCPVGCASSISVACHVSDSRYQFPVTLLSYHTVSSESVKLPVHGRAATLSVFSCIIP